MANALRPAVLALGVLTLSGCATAGGSRADQGHQAPQIPARPQVHQSSAGATLEASDPRLAAALLAEKFSATAEHHLGVAAEYRRLGVLDAAHTHLILAVRKAPQGAEAHEGLARSWRDWGLPDRALGPAYRAAWYDPRSAAAQNTLGTVLDALGEVRGARQAFERAVTIDPSAAWALNNLCYVEFRLGRLHEARTRCEAALRLSPHLVAAHNNLALSYAAAGDLARARIEFLAAGDVAAAEYNLGIVHLAEGEYASAADAFEQAIKARPTFTAAKARAHAARVRLLTGSD